MAVHFGIVTITHCRSKNQYRFPAQRRLLVDWSMFWRLPVIAFTAAHRVLTDFPNSLWITCVLQLARYWVL